MHPRAFLTRASASVVVSSLLVAGCGSKPKLVDEPLLVSSHDQVGSVHVSVISAARWSAFRKELQPKFDLKAADALNAALPITQTSIDRTLHALTVGIGIGLGQRGTSTTDTVTSSTKNANGSESLTSSLLTSEGGVPSLPLTTTTTKVSASSASEGTTSSSSTKTRTPSDGKDANFGSLRKMDDTRVDNADKKPEALGVNAPLQYKLAAALFQDVAVLSKHVEAIVQRNGYEAHFVLTQVSLMPRSARLPYDAYVNLSFFTSCLATAAVPPQPCGAAAGGTTVLPTERAPMVIPLLSSDNLESTLASRSAENLQQVALGLSGVLHGVGLNTQVGALTDQYGAFLGRQLNSIMTVGRVTDNTLRVRLGAVPQGPAGNRMVARTHNVSLVVLVPKEAQRVTITAKTEFVDPATTNVLPSRSVSSRESDESMHIVRKYPEFNLGADKPNANFEVLNQIAFAGDQQAFWAKVNELFDATSTTGRAGAWAEPGDARARHENRMRKATYLWADMASLIPGSRFNHTSFDLPRPEADKTPANTCPIAQSLVLTDDGNSMRGVLNRANELVADKLEAQLSWPECSGAVVLAPIGIGVAGDGRTLALEFPSTAKLALGPACRGQPVKVDLSGCSAAAGSTTSFPVRYLAPPQPPTASVPKASVLSISSTSVSTGAGSNGRVEARLVRGAEKKVFLRLAGADLLEADGGGVLADTSDGVELLSAGSVALAMRNLVPGASVSLWLEDDRGRPIAGTRKTLAVRGLPVARSDTAPRR